MKKVFLGGTCNESDWRDKLIPILKIDYYNPVVENWTEECMTEEIKQRKTCDFCLYTLTPMMTGVYSVAEVVDDSNKRPHKTILCILNTDGGKKFDKQQTKSLEQVAKMIENNGSKYFQSLKEVTDYLNKRKKFRVET